MFFLPAAGANTPLAHVVVISRCGWGQSLQPHESYLICCVNKFTQHSKMFHSFTYSAAVIPLVMLLRPSVTQDLSDSSVTVELLDNRSTYCLGETARIRCNIPGSDNDSEIVFDWMIGSTIYNPETIALPGHTVSTSDHFVLQVFQTETYSANYSCSRRKGRTTIKSRAKLLTFTSKCNEQIK